MRNFDPDSLRALQDLDALGAPEQPLSAGELDRLSAAVFARIEKPENEQRPAHPAPARRRRNARRCRAALRTLAAAAAAVCACTVTVAAVGPALLKMFSGRIGFFDAAPAATAETADPLDAPRGSYGGAQTRLEAYNAAVGQSVENGGVTMTLDNIAMDVSGMDAFFTVEGNEAIRAILGREGYEPDWDKLRQLFTVGGVTLNGSQTALFCNQTDFYLDESGRLKLWAHYLLNTLPEGDALTVVINAQCNVAPEADPLYGDFQPFTFTVELDGASVRAPANTGRRISAVRSRRMPRPRRWKRRWNLTTSPLARWAARWRPGCPIGRSTTVWWRRPRLSPRICFISPTTPAKNCTPPARRATAKTSAATSPRPMRLRPPSSSPRSCRTARVRPPQAMSPSRWRR